MSFKKFTSSLSSLNLGSLKAATYTNTTYGQYTYYTLNSIFLVGCAASAAALLIASTGIVVSAASTILPWSLWVSAGLPAACAALACLAHFVLCRFSKQQPAAGTTPAQEVQSQGAATPNTEPTTPTAQSPVDSLGEGVDSNAEEVTQRQNSGRRSPFPFGNDAIQRAAYDEDPQESLSDEPTPFSTTSIQEITHADAVEPFENCPDNVVAESGPNDAALCPTPPASGTHAADSTNSKRNRSANR